MKKINKMISPTRKRTILCCNTFFPTNELLEFHSKKKNIKQLNQPIAIKTTQVAQKNTT
jgi:hypothetical protein